MTNAICKLMENEEFDIWNLAAAAELSEQLVKSLPIQAQQKLTDSKISDYTGLPIKEVGDLFS